ncbi:unnamed protein product [Somion occarium]|uniref:Checkpoint protein RAD24-like helical bundle domain-containing protein n=2 Tax=Somion occarium TaxID=3059160 RepID=A0ABP1DSJ7_9APHY
MPPKGSSSQRKLRQPAVRKVSTSSTEPANKKQKLRPLSALISPVVFDPVNQSSQSPSQGTQSKGKGKEVQRDVLLQNGTEDQMWIDLHEPLTEENLAVHRRKVQDVRQWFLEAFDGGPSGKLRKYRRILVLAGPAGTAKTATVRMLSRELGLEILEWRNGSDERHHRDDIYDSYDHDEHFTYEGLSERFQAFLTRATNCHSVVGLRSNNVKSSSASSSGQGVKRQIVLLEDLPNILHARTQQTFHEALVASVNSNFLSTSPIVIIISDAGLRGETDPDDMSYGSSWKGKGRETLDVRTALPRSLIGSPYVTQIEFNPIAPTLMKRALQQIIDSEFSSSAKSRSRPSASAPSKEVLNFIIESSNGDIRSAIMALQFASTSVGISLGPDSQPSGKGKSKSRKSAPTRALMEVVTRREQSLALFHLIGKLLYNKRKGDPSAPSAPAKDIQRDREIDTRLKDLPKLPSHLSIHDREPSRVDVETLYADSPIDSGLLSLYIHQNYTQFCDDLDQCEGVMDWLSWVDCSGGESWYQANPYRFHLISLGTLHSLPTPVTRRNQKNFKPEFFDVLKRTRDCDDGVRDVHQWLRRDEYGNAGGWTQTKVVLELGAVLKAREQRSNIPSDQPFAPPSSRLFTRMPFTKESHYHLEVVKDDNTGVDMAWLEDNDDDRTTRDGGEATPLTGGWLEDDDIEEC